MPMGAKPVECGKVGYERAEPENKGTECGKVDGAQSGRSPYNAKKNLKTSLKIKVKITNVCERDKPNNFQTTNPIDCRPLDHRRHSPVSDTDSANLCQTRTEKARPEDPRRHSHVPDHDPAGQA